MNRPTQSFRLTFVSSLGVFASFVTLACINAPGVEDDDKNSNKSSDSASDSVGDPDAYVVRGASAARKATLTSKSEVRSREQENPMECPFPPDSPPCTDEACKTDHQSQACDSVIQMYCSEHADEPACKGPGDEGPGDEGPGDEGPGDEGPGEPQEVFSPDSLYLKVYAVKFSTDAEGCSDPILVGEPENPEYVDFFSSPNLINAAKPPPGSYSCVIITMSDHIKWTLDGDNACAGEHIQDVYSPDEQGPDGVESIIDVYFSTAGSPNDDHKSGSDAFKAPGLLLESPHIASDDVLYSTFVCDVLDKVELRYQSWDDSWECDMQPPIFRFETEYSSSR